MDELLRTHIHLKLQGDLARHQLLQQKAMTLGLLRAASAATALDVAIAVPQSLQHRSTVLDLEVLQLRQHHRRQVILVGRNIRLLILRLGPEAPLLIVDHVLHAVVLAGVSEHHRLVLVLRSRVHHLEHGLLDDRVDLDAGRAQVQQIGNVAVVLLDLFLLEHVGVPALDFSRREAKLGNWLILPVRANIIVPFDARDVDVQTRAVQVLDTQQFRILGGLQELRRRLPILRLHSAHILLFIT